MNANRLPMGFGQTATTNKQTHIAQHKNARLIACCPQKHTQNSKTYLQSSRHEPALPNPKPASITHKKHTHNTRDAAPMLKATIWTGSQLSPRKDGKRSTHMKMADTDRFTIRCKQTTTPSTQSRITQQQDARHQ
jgi:hypothetical protein